MQLLAVNEKIRILALTATPGCKFLSRLVLYWYNVSSLVFSIDDIFTFAAKQITIQAVVDNLHMSCLEYRDENDPDVSQYTHNRKLELIQVCEPLELVRLEV